MKEHGDAAKERDEIMSVRIQSGVDLMSSKDWEHWSELMKGLSYLQKYTAIIPHI